MKIFLIISLFYINISMSEGEISIKLLRFLHTKVKKKILNRYLSVFQIRDIRTDTLFPICINQDSSELNNFINKYGHLRKEAFVKLKKMEYPILDRFSMLNINKYTLIPIATLTFISHLNRTHQGHLQNYITHNFGNNSLEIIKEHRNIRRLTPLTLVPITFIYGHKILQNQYNTSSNRLLTKSHKILKDPLLQKYFKMIMVKNTAIPSSTMIPIGNLLSLHYVYEY
jgi:hypothetical protein